MIYRFSFGSPIDTEAVCNKPEALPLPCPELSCALSDFAPTFSAHTITFQLSDTDIVYGLGENVRGINKRGFSYRSYCTDDPIHTEEKHALYAAHNFLLVNSLSASCRNFGLFVDTPGEVLFDIGEQSHNLVSVSIPSGDYDLYILLADEAQTDCPDSIVSNFRALIGESYIAPLWGFGYAQSRWGYKSSEDFRNVYAGYKALGLPLDAIYVDIDYMERYKDFTINRDTFPDFEQLVSEMLEKGVHLVPIIDAGVKIEPGYSVYEEGVANGYFCKDADGDDFVVGVWPGDCHFPDMLNDDARKWFGDKYKFLLDMGIRGFWNDMNEPAIFYSKKNLSRTFEKLEQYKKMDLDVDHLWEFLGTVEGIKNSPEDYRFFYHNYKGQTLCHDKVHNLFGYYMTRGAQEAFERLLPDEKVLMVSRASYIGMHRYSGIWTGDNASIWSHLQMNVKMMPSLNMCGFLYTGADMGGFGANTNDELLLRWTAFSLFTPLMRNHSSLDTRQQEFYQFPERVAEFKNLLTARYRLVPYLYRTYVAAAKENKMMFRPLGFLFPQDQIAREVENQLFVGDAIMIAPVVEANTSGRIVYFPERMKEIRFENCEVMEGRVYEPGFHYIPLPLGTANLFIREGHSIPIGEIATGIEAVDFDKVTVYC